jgi:hypothetical protein
MHPLRALRRLVLVSIFPLFASVGSAADFHLDSAGLRGGFSANESGVEFNEADLIVNWRLPWRWSLGKDWWMQSRLDASAGWLGSRSANACVGTLGPTLVISRQELPLSFECGISPTGISRYDLGAKNFGTYFQFTSHAGLNWDFTTHWRLSYRFQHMSNASISGHNPGLNLNYLGASYLF